MSEYLLSLIGVVLLSAILTAILPNGKTAGLIKSVTRMVCVLAIISPILTFFQSGSLSVGGTKNSNLNFPQSVIEKETAFIHYYSEMRIAETEKALKRELFDKFAADTDVQFIWETVAEDVGNHTMVDLIKIKQIHIKMIKRQDEEVVRKMWEYLTKNYCSEVLIE